MKLKSKLPLAFAGTLVLLFAAALVAIAVLRGSLAAYETDVMTHVDQRRAVKDLDLVFRRQVQEWKDTLLRGKDPAALDKHWSAFLAREHDVDEAARQLAAALPAGESHDLVTRFAAAHVAMGEHYRQGLEAFKAAAFDPAAGDAAVKGMDRPPAQLLSNASDRIGKEADAIAARASAEGRRAVATSLVVMFAVTAFGIGLALWISRRIVRPLDHAVTIAEAVAAGDLAAAVQARGNDETAAVLRALATMQAQLSRLVLAVRDDAQAVAAASTQIADGSVDLSQRTEEQASALQQTAASIEELASTVRQSADHATQARQLAAGATATAARGGDVVHQVVEMMKGIHEGSRRIADIIGVIDGIAFQTNILALNAAVEAARAGEQGRGFAVVAGEVRALAQRSAEAARQIKTLIGDSVARVERGSSLVGEAGGTMTEIVAAIHRVADILGEIGATTTEQHQGVDQINVAVSQIDATTQRNAALVEECAASADSLRQQAERLVGAVSVFRLAGEPARLAAA